MALVCHRMSTRISSFLRSSSRSKAPSLAASAASSRNAGSEAEAGTDCSHRPSLAQADNMTDIGLRSIFTPEHDMIRASMRRFYQEEAVPHYLQWEKNGIFDREIFEKAGDKGYLGCSVPEELGGPGGDFLTEIIFSEEAYYAHCQSLHGLFVQNHLVIPYLLLFGTPEQRDHYLPQVCSGKMIGCLAMSEPAAGSDVQGLKTYAREDGDDLIINGSKVFITNGTSSDIAIVATVTNREAERASHGISLVLLEASDKGFHKGQNLRKVGLKGADTGELFFEDVRVPKCRILGEVNKGFVYMMQNLPLERLVVAGWSQSHSEKMFEITREYVKERKAFSRRIADFQVIQHKLAEMKTEICVNRAFVDNCLNLYQQTNHIDPVSASMCKYKSSDMEMRVADACLQMHGGWGYMQEMPIARSFVDARPQSIYAGTNEIMKELVARSVVRH